MNRPTPKLRAFPISACVVIVASILGLHYLTSAPKMPPRPYAQRIDQHLKEISAACFRFTTFSLAPRQDELFFLYGGELQSELCKLSFISGQTTTLPTARSVQRLFRWSPNDRYLLIKTESDNYKAHPKAKYAKPEWLVAYDHTSGKLHSVTTAESLISNYPVWLTDDSFLYSASLFDDADATQKIYLARWLDGAFQSKELHLPPDAVESLSSKSKIVSHCGGSVLAYAGPDGVKLLDLQSSAVTPIRALSNASFTGFNWLSWAPEKNRLLFCATKTGENFRTLFAYDLTQESLEKLSTIHSYNGQWLQGGNGFAFVGKEDDFFLAIRPHDQGSAVNLFTNGYVDNYVAAFQGDYVVAIASTNSEPRALWRYDLATRRLDCLKSGQNGSFRFSKLSEAQSFKVSVRDRLNIPVYLFPPTHTNANQKSPLVVYIPPRTGPAYRGYELRAQLLANLGFYYAGVNYRGCEGYGSAYSAQWNEAKAAEDVLQVVHDLCKRFDCDPQRVFAVSVSAGCSVLQAFLRQFPTVVRGAVFIGPAAWPADQYPSTKAMPRLFVSLGQNDSGFEAVRVFEDWTRSHRASASFQYFPNYSHLGLDIPKRIEQERAVAEFLLKNL